MVVPLIVGAARVAGKKVVKVKSARTAHNPRLTHIAQQRTLHKAPNHKPQTTTPSAQSQSVRIPVAAQRSNPKTGTASIKKKVLVTKDALKTISFVSYLLLTQIVFSVLAIDAFNLEDKWYGFLIPAYTAGVIFYILSVFSSCVAIATAGFMMKKYFKNTDILVAFIFCVSGAVALPIVPWAGLWIGYTAFTILFKKT